MRAILVPIDGSSLSETALPVAFAIARRLSASRVETVSVIPPPIDPLRGGGAPVRDTRFDHDLRADAQEMVAKLERRLPEMSSGVPTTATMLEGDAAERIAAHLGSGEYDLVVMTTHGRSGASRLWLGSVADRLVRQSPVPVLLLRDVSSTTPRDDEPLFADVLVPLAADDNSELILSDALALAGEGATYHLFSVVVTQRFVPPPSALDVVTASAAANAVAPSADLLGATRDATAKFVEEVAGQLRKRGVRATTKVLIHDNPAEAILTYAHEINARLIAMASRGRGPARRMFLGSVTDKVVRGASVPVLVFVP